MVTLVAKSLMLQSSTQASLLDAVVHLVVAVVLSRTSVTSQAAILVILLQIHAVEGEEVCWDGSPVAVAVCLEVELVEV